MEELINFSACNNALNGTLPDMSNTKMQFLRLSSNQLIGGPVTGMTDLTFLSLRDNAIVGPAPDLSAMTKLTDLYLDCNHYSGALPAVYGTMKFSVHVATLSNASLCTDYAFAYTMLKHTGQVLH
jgi:hypothetical protein